MFQFKSEGRGKLMFEQEDKRNPLLLTRKLAFLFYSEIQLIGSGNILTDTSRRTKCLATLRPVKMMTRKTKCHNFLTSHPPLTFVLFPSILNH